MALKMNCICLDDELPALKLMEDYCRQLPEIHLLRSFNDTAEALDFVRSANVDLVILDIQMPGLDGIDFFRQVSDRCLGIFISANPAYAVEAFEIDIVDFILKPASFARFEKAVRKAAGIFEVKQNRADENYILVKEDFLTKKVRVSDIACVQGSGEYLKIITPEKNYLVFQRMKDFEEKYARYGFVRIHKSYLVLKESIVSQNFNSIKLKNGMELPLGRAYKELLK